MLNSINETIITMFTCINYTKRADKDLFVIFVGGSGICLFNGDNQKTKRLASLFACLEKCKKNKD